MKLNIKCIFGFHDWIGCKCYRCGKTRDNEHSWTGNCEECARCGATRNRCHNWDGCVCKTCGSTRAEFHDWTKDCESCAKCDATRQNTHNWDACKCLRCGKVQHGWGECGAECLRCGAKRSSLDNVEFSLYPDGKVSHVCINFRSKEDFVLWCKKSGVHNNIEVVDSGNTLSGGRGYNVVNHTLTYGTTLFAKVRNYNDHSIELGPADDREARHQVFLRFCKLAITSSSRHDAFIEMPSGRIRLLVDEWLKVVAASAASSEDRLK